VTSFTKLFFLTAISVVVALALGGSALVYSRLLRHDGTRIANIRLLPPEVRSTAISMFAQRFDRRPAVVLIGDSQMFGFGYSEQHTFGAKLRELVPGSIYNLSILNGRFDDFERVVQILEKLDISPGVIVTNISPFSLKAGPPPRHLPDTESGNFFARILRTDETAFFLNPIAVARLNLFEEGYVPESQFNWNPVDPDYFRDLNGRAQEKEFRAFLDEALKVASRVVVFVSPDAHQRFDRLPRNYGWQLATAASALLAVCREYERVRCEDFASALPTDRFFDVIHFNARGHQEFAEILAKALQ
jgi:hypothetical protein